MLSDRDYMRRDPNAAKPVSPGSLNPRQYLLGLIIITAIIFIVVPQPVVRGNFVEIPKLYHSLAFSWKGFEAGYYWQFITSIFMHGSFGHLFFNMWGVYIFGSLIIQGMGIFRFTLLYLISGVIGNLLWLLSNMHSEYYLVGASGALFGVMLAVAMFNPNTQFMLLFFPVPIRAKTLVIIYGLLEIILEFRGADNIAHLAHLGGIIGAYVFLKIIYKNRVAWDPLGFLRRKQFHAQPPPSASNYRAAAPTQTNTSSSSVDEILDKLSRHGPNSLTDAEREVLNRAREKYNKH